ncbi:MAG: acyl-CoA thioesterase [bacterium]|nr:acyl-CoA thioesterase [bacterium]
MQEPASERTGNGDQDWSPPGYDIVTRHLVMERDLNAAGSLYGGAILAWLDEAAAVYVMEQIGYRDFVTVAMDNVYFKAPAYRGDLVTFHSRISRIGSSSVTAEVCAYVHEPVSGSQHETIACTVTFVCLKDRKTYPYFQSDEYRDWLERRNRGQ